MRLSRLLPCVVIAGMVGVSVFGQNEPETDFERGIFPTPAVEEAAEPTISDQKPSEKELWPAETVAHEEGELRKQYLQLIEQKTSLMDRSALREAISRTERDIDELKASEKLHEARQLLLELVKTYPDTTAARVAREMLQADPESRVPVFQDRGTLPSREPYEALPAETFDRGTGVLPRGDAPLDREW